MRKNYYYLCVFVLVASLGLSCDSGKEPEPEPFVPELSLVEGETHFDFLATGGLIELAVSANASLSVDMPDWVQRVSASKASATNWLAFQVQPNNSGQDRTGSIVVKNEDLSLEFTLAQAWKIEIPDPNFKAFLLGHFDLNGDGEIIPSEADAVTVIEAEQPVDPTNPQTSFISLGIASLEGVEAFAHLEELRFRHNQVTSVDLSGNPKLKRLNCADNQITTLDVSMCPALEGLDCSRNPLTALNLNGCTELTELYCRKHQLKALDISQNVKLTYLHCNDGQLVSLDVSRNPELYHFYCYANQLGDLNVSHNPKLEHFRCDQNQLTSLDLPDNSRLWYFQCHKNQLTSLQVKDMANLNTLQCESNRLESLDLGDCPGITYLSCGQNPDLRMLTLGECPNMTTIRAYRCALESVDLSGLPLLGTFQASDNYLSTLDVSYNTNLTSLEVEYNPLLASVTMYVGQEIPILRLDPITVIHRVSKPESVTPAQYMRKLFSSQADSLLCR